MFITFAHRYRGMPWIQYQICSASVAHSEPLHIPMELYSNPHPHVPLVPQSHGKWSRGGIVNRRSSHSSKDVLCRGLLHGGGDRWNGDKTTVLDIYCQLDCLFRAFAVRSFETVSSCFFPCSCRPSWLDDRVMQNLVFTRFSQGKTRDYCSSCVQLRH